MVKYDWPPTEGLVALVKKYGQGQAAERLGVGRSTLREHLVREGVPAEDRQQTPQALKDDALKELHDLLS